MLQVTMTEAEARKLFDQYGQELRDLATSRKADLQARHA